LVSLTNISPSILEPSYDPKNDPLLTKKEIMPKEYEGYNGDIVFEYSEDEMSEKEEKRNNTQRAFFEDYLERSGLEPYYEEQKPNFYLADAVEVIRFGNNPTARIELYKEEIDETTFYRARFFGVPLINLRQRELFEPGLLGRIEKALYKGKK